MMKHWLMRGILGGLALTLLIAPSIAVRSAWLNDVPQTLLQPDGTRLECFASGDEFYHWLHDADGYTIVKDPATGFFVYAREEAGSLSATDHVAGRVDPAAAGLAPRARISEECYRERRERFALPEGQPVESAPTTGTIQNVVVFIRFADEDEWTQPIADYENRYNSEQAGYPSKVNYYREVSWNQLDVFSTFYPTQGQVHVVSYQDSQERSYFQPFDATTNPNGYKNSSESRLREHGLLQRAVAYIDPMVPDELAIDADGDNRVDNVAFIVKGSPDGWADLLWPHRWSLYTYTVELNGKRVYDYNLNLQTMSSLGTLCHEFFHSLGAPDLYHYSYDGISPASVWDLMEGTLEPPQHMLNYMKYKYGLWIDEIPEISAPGVYTLNPTTAPENNILKIPSPNSGSEYFVVEYRKAEGVFDGSLPGTGLLILRINPNYDGNASGPPDEVYLYRPGGSPSANGSPSQAYFTADECRIALNDETTSTTSFLTNGSPGGLEIGAIGAPEDTISFELGNTETCCILCEASTDVSQGPAPLEVHFDALDRTFECGDGYAVYFWDFGDGNTSDRDYPTYVYETPGTYTWTFTASLDGVECTHSGTVVVEEPCTLTCSGSADPRQGEAPLAVTFTGTASASNCTGEPAFAWDFGDGAASTDQSPEHSYEESGSYTWLLTVTVDDQSCTSTGVIAVDVAYVVPGDCNGDEAVSIGEVQSAINMFLQNMAIGCGVDTNEDGQISIGEVQFVINMFLSR